MAVAFPYGSERPLAALRPTRDRSADWLHQLTDGAIVALRWLGPEDAHRIRAGFERLSPASRYRRFFTAMPRLPDAMLARLSATDGWNHVAIGAETLPAFGGMAAEAGVARFHRVAGRPDAAEVAVTVIDEFQGRGLGRILLRELAIAARERDVNVLVADVLPDNAPMIRLIRKLDPTALPELRDGVWTYEMSIDPAARLLPVAGRQRAA